MSEQQTERATYDVAAAQDKWLREWEKHPFTAGEGGINGDGERRYALTMFPYPSGDLHMGHAEVFALHDVIARYWWQKGFEVLNPMGFDSFGLNAENAAIRDNEHPATFTYANIAVSTESSKRFGASFDWTRTFNTSDPDYYRWTQWLFLKFYERGLAYRKKSPVNWCPNDQTVLANEQVIDGHCERCGAEVTKRELTQWYFKITDYAQELLDCLDDLAPTWPERVITAQRNWIGRSEGAHVTFPVEGHDDLTVYTTRPDTVFGATFMVVAADAALAGELVTDEQRPAYAAYLEEVRKASDIDRLATDRPKTGVFLGVHATNPVTGAQIPVYAADYVLADYGTGAIMAVPAQDQRDWDFATISDLPVVRTVQPPAGWEGEAYVGDGPAVNSANDEISLDGMHVAEAKRAIIEWLERRGAGRGTVTYRLRDWLFSRQRYWGEPFPIVYDETGLPIALPESMLPVVLPETDDFSPRTFDPDDADSEPETPLSRKKDWVNVELDLGDGPKQYTRETNTMPQWAGSCWYELRYLDPRNEKALVDPDNEAYWMGPQRDGDCGGVDLYVGGVEHAVLHLLYARFWHKVLYDLGHVSSFEPFRKLFNQGYIQAYAYQDERGFYVPAEEVVERDGKYYYDDKEVTRSYGKMGKSLKNVVTPDEMW